MLKLTKPGWAQSPPAGRGTRPDQFQPGPNPLGCGCGTFQCQSPGAKLCGAAIGLHPDDVVEASANFFTQRLTYQGQGL